MKSNIDLTDNEIFSRRHSFIDLFFGGILIKGLPWNIKIDTIDADDNFCDRNLEYIFPLGDKKRRQFIRECIDMDSGDHCDCCGCNLNTIPWNRTYGLCGRCMDQFENDYRNKSKKILWEKTKEMKPDREKMFRG